MNKQSCCEPFSASFFHGAHMSRQAHMHTCMCTRAYIHTHIYESDTHFPDRSYVSMRACMYLRVYMHTHM